MFQFGQNQQFLLYLPSLLAELPVQITWLLKHLKVCYGNPHFSPTASINIQDKFGVSAQHCSATVCLGEDAQRVRSLSQVASTTPSNLFF